MPIAFRIAGAVGLALIAAPAGTAFANPLLPVQNLTFDVYSGFAPKTLFSAVNPANWIRGNHGKSGDLVSIDAPDTATIGNNTHGNAYGVFGPFANPPSGGNFIQADGNPDYESSFGQLLTGLTPFTTYDLSFWQAAGQQKGFTGATTEQWKVFFGAGSPTDITLSGPVSHIYGVNLPANTVEVDSPLMNTPSQGVSPWLVLPSGAARSATHGLDRPRPLIA